MARESPELIDVGQNRLQLFHDASSSNRPSNLDYMIIGTFRRILRRYHINHATPNLRCANINSDSPSRACRSGGASPVTLGLAMSIAMRQRGFLFALV